MIILFQKVSSIFVRTLVVKMVIERRMSSQEHRGVPQFTTAQFHHLTGKLVPRYPCVVRWRDLSPFDLLTGKTSPCITPEMNYFFGGIHLVVSLDKHSARLLQFSLYILHQSVLIMLSLLSSISMYSSFGRIFTTNWLMYYMRENQFISFGYFKAKLQTSIDDRMK